MTAREIVAEALEITPAERAAYLRVACGDDQDLLQQAEDLLNTKPSVESLERTATVASEVYEGLSGSTVVGPYKLVRQLGEGGMGVVFYAQQLLPIRRDVALKIIKPGMGSRQVIARFESERQALAMMDHPNIARVFDAGATSTGEPYFVMELVRGIPITDYCDSKRLNLTERIELFLPICKAIQHAHQKGIIHRDIKPSNILITEQEGRPLAKVIDFGLAKALGHQLSDTTIMTNLGTVVGTLEYMSPEQAELGRPDIDTRSDIYSLGGVLYELLTGTTPLEHDRTAKAAYLDVLQRIREEEPAPPSARTHRSTRSAEIAQQRRSDPARLAKLLHGELDWIVMKALEKDRTRRYETVNGLARDLERYLEGEPVEAAPPSTAYRLHKFVRKHRVWLATAALFLAVLVAGIVVSSWMAVQASRAKQEAQAVNSFLQDDLLAQAGADTQARPDTKPDPDLKVRTALDRAGARITGKFNAQPLVEASIQQTIGNAYNELGLYPDAQRHLERALALRNRFLGEKDPSTLSTMYDLANDLYRYQGKYAQAEPLFIKVLEERRRVLGEEHPWTLGTMNRLADLYRFEGKYDEAESLFSKALAGCRRVLGEEHPQTLDTMNNLALLYQRRGKYAEAESLFSKALEGCRRVLGEEHPKTLIIKNNLAALYRNERRYAEAESLFTKVLEVRRRVLGDEHLDTRDTMNDLAVLYVMQGRYPEAEPLLTKLVEMNRRVLGEEHPRTLSSMNSLVLLDQNQGKYAEAEPLYMKILEVRRRVLGEEHPNTLSSMSGLALVYLNQGKYAQAEPLIHEALSSYRKTMSNSWGRYDCESLLGASLGGQKKYAEAEPLLLSGYQGMLQREVTIPAFNRFKLEQARKWIAQLYQDWGKPEKAAEWRKKLQVTSAVPTKP